MERLIHVKSGTTILEGMLQIPEAPLGIVIFAHGSGSSRFSPRNNFVADMLRQERLGTLLIDLLSPEEDTVYETRFNIELLTERLKTVVQWVQKEQETAALPIALFGSSTGAAAALKVASALKKGIASVVSRGGRPDLAIGALRTVTAPTLFIVGGEDFGVIELNQEAFENLICKKKFEIVPHATHLFEEPGCLEQVAKLAGKWFTSSFETHLAG